VESSVVFGRLDVMLPEADGRLVGHQLPAAGVVKKDFPQLRVRGQVAEDLAAGEMVKVGDAAQDAALRSLARAGRAKQQHGAEFYIFHVSGATGDALEAGLVSDLHLVYFR